MGTLSREAAAARPRRRLPAHLALCSANWLGGPASVTYEQARAAVCFTWRQINCPPPARPNWGGRVCVAAAAAAAAAERAVTLMGCGGRLGWALN